MIVSYADGLPLSMSYRGDSMVLSFGVGVLGTWTCLIVVEQAIAYQRKSNQSGSRMYLAWLALSSIALGSCAIWGLIMIGLSATDIDSLSIYFDPVTSMMALLYACILSFVSLWLQLWSAQRIRISLVMRVPIVGQSMIGAGYASDGPNNSSAATRLRVQQIQVTPLCGRDHMRYIRWPTVLASALFVIAMSGAYDISFVGSRVAAIYQRRIEIEVISLLVSWPLVTFVYAAYFHAERQMWRISSAFALALIIFGIHQIRIASLTWYLFIQLHQSISLSSLVHCIAHWYVLY
jgi:hypothetical protein